MWFWAVTGAAVAFSAGAAFLIGSWLPTIGDSAKLFATIFVLLVVSFTLFIARYYPVVKFLGFIHAAALLMGFFVSYIDHTL